MEGVHREELPALRVDAAVTATRRELFRWSGLAAAGLAVAGVPWPELLRAAVAGTQRLRVGLIGCDSEGIGLVQDALAADPRVELVALADEHGPRVERARAVFTHRLRRGGRHRRVSIARARCLSGAGAAAALCALPEVDAVLLAGVPARRPEHLAAALAAGRHAYLLAPGAVDAAGCRSLDCSGREAARRGLALGAALPWRYDAQLLALHDRVRAGRLGRPVAAATAWRRGAWRRYTPGGAAEENWYFDEGLSGGFLLGDCFETVDVMSWFLGGLPESASGRIVRDRRNPGDLASHYALEFQYPHAVPVTLEASLVPHAPLERRQRLIGSAGMVDLEPMRRLPARPPRVAAVGAFLDAVAERDPAGRDARRLEFDALVAGTRAAILGREAARAGRPLDREAVA